MKDSKNTRRARINEKEYTHIKVLCNADVPTSVISKAVLRSVGTVAKIASSESYEDYRTKLAEINKVYHERYAIKHGKLNGKKAQEAMEVLEYNPEESADEPQRMTYQDHQVERIANALERLADAWEAHPSRKGLFK